MHTFTAYAEKTIMDSCENIKETTAVDQQQTMDSGEKIEETITVD